MNCPVCRSNKTFEFLRREKVPVHQNLIVNTEADAKRIRRGNMALGCCPECGFVFNAEFDASLLSYGPQYDNNQAHSDYFRGYVNDLIRLLIDDKGFRGRNIVEVGCGKGYFLKDLCEAGRSRGMGFDPSYVGPASVLNGTVRYEKKFYERQENGFAADAVVCRHVIEHIPDPVGFLGPIRRSLDNTEGARVFFETPTIEWIIAREAFWDIFYEHCSYFSERSLAVAFQLSGFRVETIKSTFEGQYLYIIAGLNSSQKRAAGPAACSMKDLVEGYAQKEKARIKRWKTLLRKYAASGRIAVWGAGAKGMTFVNLVDPDRVLIDAVVDLNPNKQGKFIAGTGHPIVPYKELARRQTTTAILMNPNYMAESVKLLKEHGIKTELICV